MQTSEQIRARRKVVLAELASLEEIRRGSVTEQFVEATKKDGSKVRRGPYPLYTFKEKGKTVSRRLKRGQEVENYRQQIDAFRRFQELMAELLRMGEQFSDLPEDAGKKKRRRV
jgi:hypothetical protein